MKAVAYKIMVCNIRYKGKKQWFIKACCRMPWKTSGTAHFKISSDQEILIFPALFNPFSSNITL
jgi:hypothetical protein